MAFDEGRAMRNGIPLPIQCLQMEASRAKKFVRMHYHDYTELLFGLSGTARIHMGNGIVPLAEGDLLLIHPHVPHDVCSETETCYYTVIKFLPEILLSEGETYPSYHYTLPLTEQTPNMQCLFTAAELKGSDLPARFTHLMEEWKGEEYGYELSLRADVIAIFLFILRRWRAGGLPMAEGMQGGQGEMIHRALAYVRQHYADLSEDAVAAACGVSRTYFSRCFKRTMHQGFSAYVTSLRLREAERMLLTTDMSMTDIAQEVGFSTSSYFIDRFRALHGVTPHQYRAMGRQVTGAV